MVKNVVSANSSVSEPADHSMLRGMKGYQLTPGDLEFIQKMQEEKLIAKLKVGLFFEGFSSCKNSRALIKESDILSFRKTWRRCRGC